MTLLTVPAPQAPTPTAEAATLPPLEDSGAHGIGLPDVARLALGSLFANPTRSLLTMLGVIIGVAAVVALLALGDGASRAITGQISAIGTNLLTVLPGSPQNQGPGGGGAAQTLTLADAEAIAALGLPVIGVAPQYSAGATLVAPAADTTASVAGVTPAYQAVNGLTLAAGTFIDEGQARGAAPVIVLGSTVAADLFGSGPAVGQRVRVNGQATLVIGVLTAEGGGGFGSVDDQAFVPLSFAQQRLFGARTPDGNGLLVSSIAIAAADSADLPSIQERVSALLRERHRLPADGGADDFQLLNQADFLATLTTVTTVLTIFLVAVGGISLLVGGIGIMNIMLVSVTERTREIGLRKAVGARDGDILLQFLVEALAISLAGGLIGLALGWALAAGVSLTGLLDATVSVTAVALALGFSLAVGLFFGIAPARRAARLNPIDALRYE